MNATVTQERKHNRSKERAKGQLKAKSSGRGARSKDPIELAIDRHVGVRIRERRFMVGITQIKLADSLGITFQQIQKYERGVNRVSVGKLYRIAELLEVPVSFFFDGIDGEKSTTYIDANLTRESMTVAHDFAGIDDGPLRKSVADMLKAMHKAVRGRTAA